MSKLANSNEATMLEIEQRALFKPDESNHRISDHEAFQTLHDAGIDKIKWDKALNDQYTRWVYFNIK